MNRNKGLNKINSNSSVGQLTNRVSIRKVVNTLKNIKVKDLSDNKLNELAKKLEIELKVAYPRGAPSRLRTREFFGVRQINRNRRSLRNTNKAVKEEKEIRNKKMLNEFMKNPKYNSKNMVNRMINEVEDRAKSKTLLNRNLKKLGNAKYLFPIDVNTNLEQTGGSKKKRTKRTKRKTTKKTRKPKVHTGPRGGKYIMKKGKKVYV